MEIDIKRSKNCGPVPTVCFETTQMSGIIFVKKKWKFHTNVSVEFIVFRMVEQSSVY